MSLNVHLAEAGNYINKFYYENKLSTAPKFNILCSYYYNKDLKPYLALCNNLLVDSGAFTFQKTKKVKINQYFKEYAKFVECNHSNSKIVGFFELDIDNVIGYEKVLDIRNELLEITPKIIPVWHKSLGLQEYKKMCKTFPYISFSGVNKEDLSTKKMFHLFVDYAHKHNTKVHGLGVNSKKMLLNIPFDSVDATSWLKATRFGSYKNRKLSSNYCRTKYPKIAYVELIEGIKEAQFYESYWKNRGY